MTYKCVVCGREAPVADGKPVPGPLPLGRYPSWRCIDVQACVARFMLTAE